MSSGPERYDERNGRWWVSVPCEDCGGYRYDLTVRGHGDRREARAAADAALARRAARACLSCATLRRRRQFQTATDGHALLWFDALRRDWMTWLPVDGVPAGVTLPVGVHSFDAAREAEVAARLLVGSSPMLLRVLEAHESADWQTASLIRDADQNSFQLWIPCFECSGCMVPLACGHGAPVETAAREALECLSWVHADGCPQCITRFARSPVGSDSVRVWYDTGRHDWMARAPMGADGPLLLFPLNIDRFSAGQAEVMSTFDALLEQLRGEPEPA